MADNLFKFYVYELRDPMDNAVFYVGKGQLSRLYDHDDGDGLRQTDKEKRISEIKERDCEPLRIIIGRYETEEEAYAVETTLIKWIYGFNNLTNKNRGIKSQFVRPHYHASAYSEGSSTDYPHISGIDIEAGIEFAYSNFQIQQATENDVEYKLYTIRNFLRPLAEELGATVELPDMNIPQDPNLVVHIDNVFQVFVKMRLTGNGVVITHRHFPGPNNRENFINFISYFGGGESIKNRKSAKRYYWFDGQNEIPFDNLIGIWDRVHIGLNMIEEYRSRDHT